jgi:phosphoribosylamine--glycine ligase
VVLAAGGYPAEYRRGDVIYGIAEAEATGGMVFHAGTTCNDGQLVTAGGRVLGVTGVNDTVALAINDAYQAVEKIRFEGMQYRTDIAHRARGR